MNTAVLEGVRLAYDVEGSGEPLLMIQGLGYDRPAGGRCPELLAQRLHGRDVRQPRRRRQRRHAGPVHDVAARARRARRARRGGDRARARDRRQPRRDDRAGARARGAGARATSSCSARRLRAVRQSVPMPREDGGADGTQRRSSIRRRRCGCSSRTRSRPMPHAGARRRDRRVPAANPPDGAGWDAQAGAGAAHDAMARLGEIRVPTLVVHGTADNVVDARQRAADRERDPAARGSSSSTASATCCPGSGRRRSSRSWRSSCA